MSDHWVFSSFLASDVWMYDAKASVWRTDGKGGLNVSEANLPPGRGSHVAVTLQYRARWVMLIYGGFGCASTFQVRPCPPCCCILFSLLFRLNPDF